MNKVAAFFIVNVVTLFSTASFAAVTCPSPSALSVGESDELVVSDFVGGAEEWYSSSYSYPLGTNNPRFSSFRGLRSTAEYAGHLLCQYTYEVDSYPRLVNIISRHKVIEPSGSNWKKIIDLDEIYTLECNNPDITQCASG